MAEYLTDENYYDDSSKWGTYQYSTLKDIVNNFMAVYAGNHSLVNNEERFKVVFHAKKCIRELNYDAVRNVQILELEVGTDLKYILPKDYVDYVRISMYKNGSLFPMVQNVQTLSALAYLQDSNFNIIFDNDGNAIQPNNSEIDKDRLSGAKKEIYLNEASRYHGQEGYCIDGRWYFDVPVDGVFGLNTSTANANPTFRINKRTGVIDFDSSMSEEICVLEYISDGMGNGDDSAIMVHNFFEEYVYRYIEYNILASKVGVQRYVLDDVRRRMKAEYNNARIRMSDIKPERLMQLMRGADQRIK